MANSTIRKNFIDLSKIKAKELPKKSLRANLDGTERDYEIHALSEANRNDLFMVLLSESPDRLTQTRALCLARGLDIDLNTAMMLLNSENSEGAVKIAEAVFELSNIFEEGKAKEAAEAEKN